MTIAMINPTPYTHHAISACDVRGELVRSPVWFSDGNIVLVASGTAFKVHRGQLERHSDVFRDVFTIPPPNGEEVMDGCPVVHLHDCPRDLTHFLRALYDGLYFTKARADDFEALSSVLRLSHKYFVQHLTDRCMIRLQRDWPLTLAGWDLREGRATNQSGQYNPRTRFVHPILVIQLASELCLDSLLPAAFYDLSRYGPSKIVCGTPCPGSFPSPDGPGHLAMLDQHDLCTTLAGRETAQQFLAAFLDHQLARRPISAQCANASHEGGRVCRESFYFIMLNVMRSVGGIACGRDADPLFTLVQAADMLTRTDFSDGVVQCGLKICAACKAEFSQTVKQSREEAWALIPQWFGLAKGSMNWFEVSASADSVSSDVV